MERSFKKEVEALRLGAGETFRGEGILAVTKALLQSGVSYVGGYQGAPVSHLLDVMVEAEDLLGDLGVHVETCTNEASAAAMLGASINYPLRGAVTWKSIVGTNVAADALSNLASPGVLGGALIIIGEDYGEGASVIQERSYAYAMKSSMWLLDPRPDLPTIVRMVEKGFELSEASHAPVMLELRIRACHVTGSFTAKDNRRAPFSGINRISGPARFNYARLAHPPLTFVQERLKVEDRLPAALAFIRNEKLNEILAGDLDDVGIIAMGGLTSGVLRALLRLDLADLYGATRVPILVLNAVYPLVPEEIRTFCAGKRAVLVVEEGSPDYIEQQVNVELRRADIKTRVFGKGALPKTGEYTSDVLLGGLARFLSEMAPRGIDANALVERVTVVLEHKTKAAQVVGELPPRPPNFCTGCPERPVFAAIKLMQRELGPTHISGDIGCHAFATFAPFGLGNSILGYGMSLASAAAVGPNLDRRPIAIMGDGGFWHNGLITGVTSNLFNKGDGILIVMQNGYASATGLQYVPSSKAGRQGAAPGMDIENTLRSLGAKWVRKVRTYSVAKMTATLKEAMQTAERGLKIIIADGECQLARQRRVRAEDAERLKRGARVVKTRFGVDDEICTGDHSCIRLSGCPSLTVKPNPDPLRTDPVATVIESCVGCGLCGEVAHAAVLCPSFYRADVVRNPTIWDRAVFRTRRAFIKLLSGTATASLVPTAGPSPVNKPENGSRRGKNVQALLGKISQEAPVKLLIAALGGEGGGVLTNWIVGAAERLGLPVQSTSIPGVAQRTGATTYYIEILPTPWSALGDRKPVLSLVPGVGDIDVLLASELMEAGRAVASGFATPEQTVAITSTSRFYVIDEKIAMGDARQDSGALIKAIEKQSGQQIFFDMAEVAQRTGAIINAVMLGALAASDRLPIPVEAFEAAIRADDKAVEANLRGFRAGLEAARQAAEAPRAAAKGTNQATNRATHKPEDQTAPGHFAEIIGLMPQPARDIVTEGVKRLAAYQDEAYAQLYLDRLAPIRLADERIGAGGRLVAVTARHLAVRMSYEDVIRVAQAKINPARFERIATDMGLRPGDPIRISEFLKPGIDELCSVLPPRLARGLLAIANRRAWLHRWHWGMEVNTVSVTGFLRFWALAKLRRWRPGTYRYDEEQRAIESWLLLITKAAEVWGELALEVAECARLIKGYGDTHKRGTENFRVIERHVIEPALAGHIQVARAIDAIASARAAALVDPEGESLAKCLADIDAQLAMRVAAE
ncbi:MAG TPA: indolepyruvate oxidoreductase subunit beta family protein [Xanthobacteraceae bacterium]|jgi:indolepyruvate ferredoxin oxidoreductase alpha subunit|nr:indolepyruvate oxidoreductase subunit beta family protein [Xanthobacteraceae bacterium]